MISTAGNTGKSISGALEDALKGITKDWKAAKRQADRDESAGRTGKQDERGRVRELTIKDAAYDVMPQAYAEASSKGKYPANARQIMYAARPKVLALTGGRRWDNSSYFTQHLLPDYMRYNPQGTAGWDVVFTPAATSPSHTLQQVRSGTPRVRRHIPASGRCRSGRALRRRGYRARPQLPDLRPR